MWVWSERVLDRAGRSGEAARGELPRDKQRGPQNSTFLQMALALNRSPAMKGGTPKARRSPSRPRGMRCWHFCRLTEGVLGSPSGKLARAGDTGRATDLGCWPQKQKPAPKRLPACTEASQEKALLKANPRRFLSPSDPTGEKALQTPKGS